MATAINPLPLKDNEGGALNLTRVTGLGAALVAVLTTFNGAWETIFGESTPDWAKPVVIISVIGAFAVVAAADILGRGYVAGQRGDVFRLPAGLTATYTLGKDEEVALAGVQYGRANDENAQFLVVKADKSTAWVHSDDLVVK